VTSRGDGAERKKVAAVELEAGGEHLDVDMAVAEGANEVAKTGFRSRRLPNTRLLGSPSGIQFQTTF